jgi:glucose/arabinose dehydrogenase
MTRWITILALFLSACSTPTPPPTSEPTGTSPSTQAEITTQSSSAPEPGSHTQMPLPSNEPESDAISHVTKELETQSFWWSSNTTRKEDAAQKTITFTAEFLFMAGASESAQILRFPTPEEAASSFGESDRTFHSFPSKQGSTSSFSDNHYGHTHWIEWLSGNRIFRASTSYLSTYKGEARDPTIIAEALFQAAEQYGLHDQTPSINQPPPFPSVTQFPEASSYRWTLMAEGLQKPLDITHAGDDRLFIVEQSGIIRVLQDDQMLPSPFLDIRDRVNDDASERGLLGLAFHPNYAGNGFFFVNYTGQGGHTVVSRFQVSSNPNQADPDNELILLRIQQPYANHNGGGVKFGPDGMLYIGTGDGGSGGDPQGNGQSLDTLLGKILRIDVDGEEPYIIPSDNPLIGKDGLPEIWAYGLRNPWRFSFDRSTGDLYIADVGQNMWEEINFQPAGSPGGTNYGWNLREGGHPFASQTTEGLIDPVAEYSHELGCSVTGGVVVRDPSLPTWNGVYIYGDYCTGIIWGVLQTEDSQWKDKQLFDTDMSIASFGEDASGQIYLADYRGSIYRLEISQ